MIRPNTLAEEPRATRPEMLFSPLALPDIEVEIGKNGQKASQVGVALGDSAFIH